MHKLLMMNDHQLLGRQFGFVGISCIRNIDVEKVESRVIE